MSEHLSPEHYTVLSACLDQDDAPLNNLQPLFNSVITTGEIQYLETEILKNSGGNVDYIYRKSIHLQQALSVNPNDFQTSLKACNWPSMDNLLRDSASLLQVRVRNGIRVLYTFAPDAYIQFMNEQLQPLWLFPVFEQQETININVALLLPALQAVYVATIWEDAKHFARERGESTSGYFDKLYAAVGTDYRFMMFGYLLEELVRKSFPSLHKPTDKVMYQLKDEFLSWLGARFSEKKVTDEETDIFLSSLIGRVNRETWLGALYLANQLADQADEVSMHNAALIRESVINKYPYLWVKNDLRHSSVYFTGEMSIELMSELSTAFISIKQDPISYLLSISAVASPGDLWKYRNSHDYSRYLDQRRVCFAHLLLITLVIEKYLEKFNELPVEWSKYCQRFLSYCRQWEDSYINGEDPIMKELFARMGVLFQKSGQLLEIVPVMLSYLPIPASFVYILKNIDRETEEYPSLQKIVKRFVLFYLPGMRKNTLIEVVKNLYAVSYWSLCAELLRQIKFDQISERGLKIFLAKLYASSVLKLIHQQNDREWKVNLLKGATQACEQVQKNFKYVKDTQLEVLYGYLIGEMIDLNIIDTGNIVLAYLNTTENKALDDFTSSLSYVRAELIIRLIASDFKNFHQYSGMLEVELNLAKDLPNVEGAISLMYVWLAGVTGDYERRKVHLRIAENYKEQIRQMRDVLPSPLLSLTNSILDGDPHASES